MNVLHLDCFNLKQETQKLRQDTGLPFVQYNELVDADISLLKNPFLVIQWEALHRLRRLWGLTDKKLVLLCDEWNSIMRQMESSAGSPGEDMLMFQVLSLWISMSPLF